MDNKMSGNVNFRKDKIKSMIENGYKVKVGKKSYIFLKMKNIILTYIILKNFILNITMKLIPWKLME